MGEGLAGMQAFSRPWTVSIILFPRIMPLEDGFQTIDNTLWFERSSRYFSTGCWCRKWSLCAHFTDAETEAAGQYVLCWRSYERAGALSPDKGLYLGVLFPTYPCSMCQETPCWKESLPASSGPSRSCCLSVCCLFWMPTHREAWKVHGRAVMLASFSLCSRVLCLQSQACPLSAQQFRPIENSFPVEMAGAHCQSWPEPGLTQDIMQERGPPTCLGADLPEPTFPSVTPFKPFLKAHK